MRRLILSLAVSVLLIGCTGSGSQGPGGIELVNGNVLICEDIRTYYTGGLIYECYMKHGKQDKWGTTYASIDISGMLVKTVILSSNKELIEGKTK